MRTSLKLLALVLFFSVLGSGAGFAGEKVHAALYLGENEPPPPGTHIVPEKLHYQLEQVFGFRHYRLLKEQDFNLRNEWEQWFLPRRDFFMRLEPLHHEPDSPKLIAYEIYKDGFIVVKGTYEVHDDTPLFVNGPDFRRGRLILVLEAR